MVGRVNDIGKAVLSVWADSVALFCWRCGERVRAIVVAYGSGRSAMSHGDMVAGGCMTVRTSGLSIILVRPILPVLYLIGFVWN